MADDPKVYTPKIFISYSAEYTAAQIGDAANAVNTTGKTVGKRIRDSDGAKILIASGTGATDDWDAADGSYSITPA